MASLITANPNGFLQNLIKQPSNSLAATQAGINQNNIFSKGVIAKTPEQNIKKTSGTLSSNQKATPRTDFYKQGGSYYLTNGQKILNLQELAKYAKTGKEVSAPNQPTTNSNIPQGQFAIPGGQISNYNVTGQFGTTGTPGSGLYGTLKPATTTSGASTSSVEEPKAPTDINSSTIIRNLVDESNQGSDTAQQAQDGLIGLAGQNLGTSGPAYEAYQATQQEIEDYKQKWAQVNSDIGASGVDLNYATGQKANLGAQYQTGLAALESKLAGQASALGYGISGQAQQIAGYGQAGNLGQTGQGLQQQGLTSAAGLVQPIQVPYNNQLLNPQTGESVLPAGTNVGGSLMSAIQNIAEKIQNGTMGYDAGVQALSAYGQVGVNTLQQMLGPDFNIQQSNAQAAAQSASTIQTGTVGGQVTKAAGTARDALDKLEADFDKLSTMQTGGIPLTNNIANWIASKFGQGELSTYQTTLADARAQLGGVLSATGAISPTGAMDMAYTYLPDDMTPTMLKNKLAAARALIDQKVSNWTNVEGTSGNTSSGDSLYNW